MIFLFRILVLLSASQFRVSAQDIFSFSSRYDLSLYQWILLDSLGEEFGTLDYANLPNDALRTWNISCGSLSGNIKLRWRENQHESDLFFNNRITSIHPVWPNQFDQWNIQNDLGTYNLSFLRNKEGLNWELKNSKNERCLGIMNAYYYDPRDWTINYSTFKTENDILLAAIFIIVNYSKQLVPR